MPSLRYYYFEPITDFLQREPEFIIGSMFKKFMSLKSAEK